MLQGRRSWEWKSICVSENGSPGIKGRGRYVRVVNCSPIFHMLSFLHESTETFPYRAGRPSKTTTRICEECPTACNRESLNVRWRAARRGLVNMPRWPMECHVQEGCYELSLWAYRKASRSTIDGVKLVLPNMVKWRPNTQYVQLGAYLRNLQIFLLYAFVGFLTFVNNTKSRRATLAMCNIATALKWKLCISIWLNFLDYASIFK